MSNHTFYLFALQFIYYVSGLADIEPSTGKGKTQFLCGLFRPTSDICCKLASQKEFQHLRFDDIPSESHNTRPAKKRENHKLPSTKSMITSCHDTRPDPLPSDSPRILNREVSMTCPQKQSIDIMTDQDIALPFLDYKTNVYYTKTDKGRCKPDPTRAAESAQMRTARQNRIRAGEPPQRASWGRSRSRSNPREEPQATTVPERRVKSKASEGSSSRTPQERQRIACTCMDVGPPEYHEARPNMLEHFEILQAASILASLRVPNRPDPHSMVWEYDFHFTSNQKGP